MAHDIVWTGGAEADLLRLYGRIGDHDLALKVLRAPLDHALDLLRENPSLGPVVRGTRRMRRLLLGPRMRYGVFYVQEGGRLMIHALLDMRSDPALLRRRSTGL